MQLIWIEKCSNDSLGYYTQVSVVKDVHGYPVVNLKKILGGNGVKLTEGNQFSGKNLDSIERFSTNYGNWEAKYSNLHPLLILKYNKFKIVF